jgi:DNA-binding transcriptional LysR family regulator
MRLAWFSPFAPVRSGIAACSADLVAALADEHQIDCFVDEPLAGGACAGHPLLSAHDFVWRHRRAPYDLVVYQLGNSSHHNYQWPYVFR